MFAFCLRDNEIMRLLLAMTVLLAALSRPLPADPPMTRLRIEVKNPAGNAVERASVVVKFVQGRSAVKLGKKITTSYQLRTNQDGTARIPPIPQGKILIQVIAKGYQTFGQTFDVSEEDKTIAIKLNTPQPQYSAHQ